MRTDWIWMGSAGFGQGVDFACAKAEAGAVNVLSVSGPGKAAATPPAHAMARQPPVIHAMAVLRT